MGKIASAAKGAAGKAKGVMGSVGKHVSSAKGNIIGAAALGTAAGGYVGHYSGRVRERRNVMGAIERGDLGYTAQGRKKIAAAQGK